jgi:hypothetical protein
MSEQSWQSRENITMAPKTPPARTHPLSFSISHCGFKTSFIAGQTLGAQTPRCPQLYHCDPHALAARTMRTNTHDATAPNGCMQLVGVTYAASFLTTNAHTLNNTRRMHIHPTHAATTWTT